MHGMVALIACICALPAFLLLATAVGTARHATTCRSSADTSERFPMPMHCSCATCTEGTSPVRKRRRVDDEKNKEAGGGGGEMQTLLDLQLSPI